MLKCPKDNQPLVFTTRTYKEKSIIRCNYCQKNYFGNSERFYCKGCDLNCCKDCR